MPIFEYVCRGCRHEFEMLVRRSDVPSCASCGSSDLDKKLSVFAPGKGEVAADPAPCGTCGHPGGSGSCAE